MKLFFWQWRAEMWKMLARKRTYLGFGAFLALEVLLYFMMHRQGGQSWFRFMISKKGGETFETYFSALTLAFFVLSASVFLLGAIYLTLVAGDVVAKESEDGNLRLILVRPISRLRLLTIKYICCLVYSVLLTQFVAWSALLLGTLLRGWGGGLFVFVPEQEIMGFFDPGEGLARYSLCSVLLALSMMSASSVAFFLSCWRIKPAAATIAALSYILADSILRLGHFVQDPDWLITHYMASWILAFQDTIPWASVIRNYTVLGGVSLSLFVAGVVIFESRDVKS